MAITLPERRLPLIKGSILAMAFIATYPANILCTLEENVFTTTLQPDITVTAETAAILHHIPDTHREYIPLATLNRQKNDDSPFNTGVLTGIVIGVFLLVFMVTAITTAVVRYQNDMRNEMASRQRHSDIEANKDETEACQKVENTQ